MLLFLSALITGLSSIGIFYSNILLLVTCITNLHDQVMIICLVIHHVVFDMTKSVSGIFHSSLVYENALIEIYIII